MSDFKLEGAVILQATQAISDAKKLDDSIGDIVNILTGMDGMLVEIANTMQQFGKDTKTSEKQATMSINRMKKSLAVLGLVAGGAFAGILAWSPSLQAAFSLMELHIGLAAMAIGEALAPIIFDTLLPAIEQLSTTIQNLDPWILQFIGLTISLTVAILGFIAAVKVLAMVNLTLIAQIVIIAAIIAGLILLWYNWEEVAGWVKVAIIALAIVIAALTAPISLTIAAIAAIIAIIVALMAIIKNWDEIWNSTVGAMYPVVKEAYDKIKKIFSEDIFDPLADAFRSMIEAFKGLWQSFVGVITDPGKIIKGVIDIAFGAFSKAWDTITGWASDIINWLNDKIVDSINWLLPKRLEIDDFGNLPSFHEGAVYMNDRPGLAWLKPGEKVQTETEQLADKRRLRSLFRDRNQGMGNGGNTTIIIQGGTYTSPYHRRHEVRKMSEELKREQNRRTRI